MEPHGYERSMVTHEHLLSILHVNVSMMCLSFVRMDLLELWQINWVLEIRQENLSACPFEGKKMYGPFLVMAPLSTFSN